MSDIPKIFHQIWLGNTELPLPFQVLRDHTLNLHPTWEYKLWTEKNLPPLINQKLYDSQERLFYKADVLRYEILAHYGGIYLDTDFLIYRSIEPLLRNTDHFLAYEATDWVCNSIMGFVPNHWFAWKLVAQASIRARHYNDRWGVDRFGPGLITECAKECQNLLIFPTGIFYPLKTSEAKERQFDEIPSAYGAHLWHDFVGQDGLQVWRTLPEYSKYADKDWTLEELKAKARAAKSEPKRTAGMNPLSGAEIRPGSHTHND